MTANNNRICSDSEVMIDESAKCCMGQTYKFCGHEIHKIPLQTHENVNMRLLAKTSIRVDRLLSRREKHKNSSIHKSRVLSKDLRKVRKIVRKCGKIIKKKHLQVSDIPTLSTKLGPRLSKRLKDKGYDKIIVMMINNELPHEEYIKHHHHH